MANRGAIDRGERMARRRRMMLWSFVLAVAAAVALPMLGYVYASLQPAHAQAQAGGDTNPRANYWREVRGGTGGYSAVSGVTLDGRVINGEADRLINGSGQNWRQLRNGPVATYGGWALFGMLIVLLLYFGWRGTVRIEGGRAGMTVPRWSTFERWLHWLTAIMFIVLMITGLSMLFGRAFLIPLMGPEGFAAWATFALGAHNYVGPPFSVLVVVTLLIGFVHNLPTKEDLQWLATVGGMFNKKGSAHPPSWKVNAGEKVVYWVIATFGLATVVSGLVLDFPNLGQTRETMQLSHLVHGIAAIVWMMVMLGHMYLGSFGVEGAYEGMTTGRVDANWAKQHHNLWYEQVKDQAQPDAEGRTGGAPGLQQQAT